MWKSWVQSPCPILSIQPHKNLHTDISSCILHNSPTAPQPQHPSTEEDINKFQYIHKMKNGISKNKKELVLIYTATWKNLKNIVKKASLKRPWFYDSTVIFHIRCLSRAQDAYVNVARKLTQAHNTAISVYVSTVCNVYATTKSPNDAFLTKNPSVYLWNVPVGKIHRYKVD